MGIVVAGVEVSLVRSAILEIIWGFSTMDWIS